ncbi:MULTISPECIES: glycosyltransferase family 4 protein [Mesonia]|uniref:D-inositol 3-phosphate glycosyltransferase n=1 Tax=Mesonia oceanica TaxID=2687242 RepID=A0AC61YD34_9FLAO|nr:MULTISPECIES: glycosyltransferase family 4 protein [Mesonia]MAN26656.1 glycosyltransferase [Mesonia sp.]MAQ40067.1 glycosyltransferase [Mesonia sp.]MBJ96631.1 glycosyltransferase [Flavobacteriaceae bacterium]VVV01325.1 D-inositol 3-phosphate glycosyltransferase [Mesonia oceanica]|tara:strand:- start:23701 stop:24867 length:1167 start_codon:yes stop_codon:yes gene_type:complete
MKLGLVLAQPPGYSETFFNSKIKGLQHYGFQVTLFCQTNANQFSLCEVKTFPGKSKNPFILILSFLKVFISLIPHFDRVLKWYRLEKNKGIIEFMTKVYLNAPLLKADLDWLHFGFVTMALGRESISKAIGAKMAVSFRGYDINVYPKKFPGCYSKVWDNVNQVHSISHYLEKEALSLGMSPGTPVKIITPAVDLKNINNKFSVANKATIKIVTIARLTWIKGIDFLIEAAAILHEKNINFEWIIIGEGSVPQRERYLYHIFERKLTKKVFLVGKKSHAETINLVNEADYYIQTSLNEGFCNAVLEAQALGKLCIAFNTGGLSENILDNKTGWLVNNFDSRKLIEKLVKIINLPEAKKYEIAIAAKNRVEEQFNIEKQQEEFVQFYKF